MSLFHLICDMGPAPTGTQPVVSSVSTAEGVAGTCSGSVCTVSATIVTTVTCGPLNANYTINLYENGSLVSSTIPTNGGTYTSTVTGYVDVTISAGTPKVNKNLTYRADVILTSTGQVVGSKTGNNYVNTFGTCGGPH